MPSCLSCRRRGSLGDTGSSCRHRQSLRRYWRGDGCFAGAVVNAGVRINPGAILNTCCSIDHDCLLGDAVHISPGARLAGGVQVGDLSWIGIGASVRQLICIGQRVMVGAGSAVVGDIPDDVTVAGVPAKRMR